MADIITWTTPTITYVAEDVDLTDMDLYVTVEQKSKSGSLRARVTADATGEYDGTDTYVNAAFTQDQTGQLYDGRAYVMVNAVGETKRYATAPIPIDVALNLIPEGVEHGA